MSKLDIQHAKEIVEQAEDRAMKVIAAATAEALKVSSLRNNEDHDLLIILKKGQEDMVRAIEKLEEALDGRLSDHENRIRSIEENQWKKIGMSGVVSALVTAIGFIIAGFLTK